MDRVVVVGASLAGGRAAETLRKAGFQGTVTLVGDEPHPPYDRPPLSKEVLAGRIEPASVVFPTPWTELDVDLRLGQPATGLDTEARTVALDGDEVPYDGLVIATGAAPRRLPFGHDLAGVHVLRSLDDAAALHAAFAETPRVVVIGAGFIGSEAASSARDRGCPVTVLEALSAPLVRGLGPQIGAACGRLHDDNGTDLRCGVGVIDIVGDGGRVRAVQLADGTEVPADVVVVGIGVSPTTGWLVGSGLTIDDGIVCEATLAAGPPGVYAAGDCARWPNGALGGRMMRVEHWTNAAEQGAHVARNLLAGAAAQPYEAVPFVWSDQYGSRIQVAGHPSADDDVEVLVGSLDGPFLAGYRRGEALVGVAGLDLLRPFVKFRLLMQQGGSWADGLALAETFR